MGRRICTFKVFLRRNLQFWGILRRKSRKVTLRHGSTYWTNIISGLTRTSSVVVRAHANIMANHRATGPWSRTTCFIELIPKHVLWWLHLFENFSFNKKLSYDIFLLCFLLWPQDMRNNKSLYLQIKICYQKDRVMNVQFFAWICDYSFMTCGQRCHWSLELGWFYETFWITFPLFFYFVFDFTASYIFQMYIAFIVELTKSLEKLVFSFFLLKYLCFSRT